jgi:hypothetical protein
MADENLKEKPNEETDPLTCPKCEGKMRIISFIDQPDVIKKDPSTLGSLGRVPGLACLR